MRRPGAGIAAMLGALAGAGVALPVGMHWGHPGELVAVEASPDGRERVELYRPNGWQRLTGHDPGDYAVARLSSAVDGTVVAVSPPFFLDGAGTTRWSRDAIELGVAARYDRATGRWSVR